MPDPLYSRLINTLDKHSVGEVANAVGQPQQSVLSCLEMAVTSILGALASKSGDPGTLRRIMDLAPSAGDLSWSQIASEVSKPGSPLLSVGKRVLASLFGNSEDSATRAISRESGLQPGATSTMLSMAAPMVISFLSRWMRKDGLGITDLAHALQQERPAIQSALPASLVDVLRPGATTTTAAPTPVVAQTVRHERSSSRWIPTAIALGAVALALIWLGTRAHRPTTAQVIPNAATGTASREATDTSNTAVSKLPNNLVVRFNTASDKPTADSQEQLRNLVSILSANPNVHMKISGYTDNVGGTQQNLRLSQQRANTVMAELVADGVSPDRLTAQGYGDQNPVADNSTAQGRAQNRRVIVSQQ
jgi:OmpA-OmpF porin, OOP family